MVEFLQFSKCDRDHFCQDELYVMKQLALARYPYTISTEKLKYNYLIILQVHKKLLINTINRLIIIVVL